VSLSEKGSWCGGAPPFGYDLLYLDRSGKPCQLLRFLENGRKQTIDPETRAVRHEIAKGERISHAKTDRIKLVPSLPERVETVRTICAGYIAGSGYNRIARKLNDLGVPSPTKRDHVAG